MPGPFTVKNTGTNPAPPLATFDDAGNLRVAGQVYSGGVPSLDESVVTGGKPLQALPFYLPSGDITGNKDAEAFNAALAAGTPLFLVPGNPNDQSTWYFVNQPVNQWRTGSFMTGFQHWSASPADNYGAGPGGVGGAIIMVTTDFPDNQYAFDLFNSGDGQFYGVDISGINLYGWNLPDTTPNAGLVRIDGAWGASFLRGVGLIGSTGDTLHIQPDDTTGKVPDDWQMLSVKVSGSLNGYGIWANDPSDFWWDNVESSEHGLDCWNIAFGTNARYSNCKGENSAGGNGARFGGLGAGNIATLTAFTTQFNSQDGFLFDDSAGAGTGLGTYQLTGCASTHDNVSDSGWASFDIEGCLSRVIGTGCTGQGAAYGAFEAAASYGACFTGSYLAGVTAATHDDGSNTHALVNQSPVPF